MKKNILYLLAALFLSASFTSCEDPEYVKPTADRQGITSLTALFTSGQFTDQEMARLNLGDELPDRLVIPVPWFYPITSDDETTPYMTKVRVQAALAPNCKITPALTILDLTQENHFTFTDASGASKDIIITGERVKSNACELLSFAIEDPALSGIINKNTKTVSIISADDLSSAKATFEVSAHATISPDPSATPLNYNDPVKFTVTAHDGVTKAEYTVVKEVPEKIDFGFEKSSLELLFNFDPVTNIGMPDNSVDIAPTLAALGGKLVICKGDGSTPIYLNGLTGVKMGEINLGAAEARAVTNDAAEHMLIVNHAEGNATVNIYRSNSITEAPVLFHSFQNPAGTPVGSEIKVNGNIDGDALIVLNVEGVSGVTSADDIIVIRVEGGVVTSTTTRKLGSFNWGASGVYSAGIAARTTNPDDGFFYSKYGSTFNFISGSNEVSADIINDTSGWGLNPNNLDAKAFNNQQYLALFVVSHFPSWGMGPQLYVYNVSDMSKFTGTYVNDLACLDLVNADIEWYQKGAYAVASGDLCMAPTADGYKLYIYYYDHNSQVVGGYVLDCIKR